MEIKFALLYYEQVRVLGLKVDGRCILQGIPIHCEMTVPATVYRKCDGVAVVVVDDDLRDDGVQGTVLGQGCLDAGGVEMGSVVVDPRQRHTDATVDVLRTGSLVPGPDTDGVAAHPAGADVRVKHSPNFHVTSC